MRQLVSHLPSTSNVLKELKALDDVTYPDDDELFQRLHLVASEFDKVFVIFDNANSVTAEALRDLMRSLNPTDSDSDFRVLFASRNMCTGAFSIWPEVLEIHLTADERDIETYIIETLRYVSGKDLSSGHARLIQDMVQVFEGL